VSIDPQVLLQRVLALCNDADQRSNTGLGFVPTPQLRQVINLQLPVPRGDNCLDRLFCGCVCHSADIQRTHVACCPKHRVPLRDLRANNGWCPYPVTYEGHKVVIRSDWLWLPREMFDARDVPA